MADLNLAAVLCIVAAQIIAVVAGIAGGWWLGRREVTWEAYRDGWRQGVIDEKRDAQDRADRTLRRALAASTEDPSLLGGGS